jgi:chromosome segregation ATPase
MIAMYFPFFSVRAEVDTLLRHQDESANAKAQLALAEEQSRIRENEFKFTIRDLTHRLNSALHVESDLRQLAITADKKCLEQTRDFNVKMNSMEVDTTRLRADKQTVEEKASELTHQLNLQSDQAAVHKKDATAALLSLDESERKCVDALQHQQAQMRTLEDRLDRRQAELDQRHAESADLGASLRVKQTEVDLLLQAKSTVDQQAAELRQKLVDEVRLNVDLRAMVAARESQLSRAEQELGILRSLREDKAQLTEQCHQLGTECDGAARVIRQLRQDKAKLEEQLRVSQSDRAAAQDKSESLVRDNQHLMQKLGTIDGIRAELDGYFDANTSLKQSLNAAQIDKQRLQANVARLESEVGFMIGVVHVINWVR